MVGGPSGMPCNAAVGVPGLTGGRWGVATSFLLGAGLCRDDLVWGISRDFLVGVD